MTDDPSEKKRAGSGQVDWMRFGRIVASAVVALAAGWFLAWLLIWGVWDIEHDRIYVKDKNGDEVLVQAAGIIVTGFRTAVIALLAGILTLVGLHYTRKKHTLELEQFKHAQEQFAASQAQFETTLREAQVRDQRQAELTREGQVTGRYVEAIKLVASKERYEVLGGIYALGRIMKDSEKDHPTIADVVAAYVRARLNGSAEEIAAFTRDEYDEHGVKEVPLAEDIRAALAVLQSNWKKGHKADLRGITLAGWLAVEAQLGGARLDHARLFKAQLPGADLSWSEMLKVDLRGAELRDATLVNTYLIGADLTGAKLDGANLRDIRLQSSTLKKAVLHGAQLHGARMDRVDLAEADLTGADLSHAIMAETFNLTLPQICMAGIYESTRLPEQLANDPDVRTRIAECEAARAANVPIPSADPTTYWAREE
ncbi:pentapeptide repeat-containing protein [Streptomyces sp. NPDC050439]|uniref:pentapeptide repeat-containing protein n=1 Tax=unclassified Streptomyces TaxID=2593676 RepID=UPI0034472F22